MNETSPTECPYRIAQSLDAYRINVQYLQDVAPVLVILKLRFSLHYPCIVHCRSMSTTTARGQSLARA